MTASQTADAIRSEILTLESTEVAVETNEGTYGNQEAGRKVGTSDPRHANYTVYETPAGVRRRVGCDEDRAPGYPRHLGAQEMAELKRRIAELKRRLREAN